MLWVPRFSKSSDDTTLDWHFASETILQLHFWIAQTTVELFFVEMRFFGENYATHIAVEVMRATSLALPHEKIVVLYGRLT